MLILKVFRKKSIAIKRSLLQRLLKQKMCKKWNRNLKLETSTNFRFWKFLLNWLIQLSENRLRGNISSRFRGRFRSIKSIRRRKKVKLIFLKIQMSFNRLICLSFFKSICIRISKTRRSKSRWRGKINLWLLILWWESKEKNWRKYWFFLIIL